MIAPSPEKRRAVVRAIGRQLGLRAALAAAAASAESDILPARGPGVRPAASVRRRARK